MTSSSTATTTSLVSSTTADAYDYRAELQKIMNEIETTLKAKIESALAQLDEKFEQKLKQIEQNIEQKLQKLDPIALAQAKLQSTQANQARDLEQITKNMNYLMAQVANIADRLKLFVNVRNAPTLSNSARKS